jgi:hypothetical protein
MKRHRYLIVDLKTHPNYKYFPLFVPTFHTLLSNYHYHRIDETAGVVTANYAGGRHEEVQQHEDVTVLPSQSSGRMLFKHIREKGKIRHIDALQKLGLTENSDMDEFIDVISEKFGTIFASDK